MDGSRFDDLLRTLTESRRSLVTGALAAVTGFLISPRVDAKKKRKQKNTKPKLKRNAFGCVDVGGTCQGTSANCCSGICEGAKPKKGKKDTSVCVGHDDAGLCFPDNDTCSIGQNVPCNADNQSCLCMLTTGNAGFCGDFSFTGGPESVCRDCSRDTDCQVEFGPGAACVVLKGVCSSACAATGRTACIPPCT